MEELLNKIKDKSSALSNEEIIYAKELQFFNELFSDYISTDSDTILQMDDKNLLLALLHIYNLDKTFEETSYMLSEMRKSIVHVKENMKDEKILHDIPADEVLSSNFLILYYLKDHKEKSKYEIEDAWNDYNNIQEYKKVRRMVRNHESLYDGVSKKNQRFIDRQMKNELCNDLNILKIMKKIDNRRQNLLEQVRKKNKKNNKAKAAYQELLDMLKQNEQQPIMSLSKKTEEALDLETVYEVMLIIHKNNEQKYRKIKEKNDKLADKNTVTKLDECLFEYGISSSKLQKKYVDFILKSVELNDMKATIQTFLEMSFDIDEIMNSDMVYFFKDVVPEHLVQIKRLYDANIISKEFLKENPGVFLSTENKNDLHHQAKPIFGDIMQNVEIMKREKVLFPNSDYYKSKLLLTSPLELLKNEQLLYYYHRNQRGVENCQLLVDDLSFDFLDFCIEQGLDESLINSIYDLSLSKIDIEKRILISRTIGLEYIDTKGKLTNAILTGEHFCVKTEDLDFYIANQTQNYLDPHYVEVLSSEKRNQIRNCDVTSKLDELYLSENGLFYNFNGTLISKNKVLRNYTTLSDKTTTEDTIENRLLQSILYSSFLEENQIQTIKTCLSEVYQNQTSALKSSIKIKKKK